MWPKAERWWSWDLNLTFTVLFPRSHKMRARLPCRLGDRTVLLKTGQPLTSREELRFTGGGGGGPRAAKALPKSFPPFPCLPMSRSSPIWFCTSTVTGKHSPRVMCVFFSPE